MGERSQGPVPEFVRRHPWRAGVGALALALLVSSLWFWLALPDVSGLARGWPDTTAYMELRVEQAREEGRSLELRYRPVPLERIPDHLEDAVRIAEDAAFYGHEGVDWDEVRNALSDAWKEGRVPRGASTITQQLARNLYLSPSQTPWRKLREFFIARRLEREISKRRILELYLNVIELGEGIFGVDAAARRYFGVPVGGLTPAQSVSLAATIPAPRTHNPATATGRHRWRIGLIGRRMAIVDSLRREGEIPERPAEIPPPAREALPAPDTAPLVEEPPADTSAADTTGPDSAVSRRSPRSR